ncbi:MAG: glycosyltransferase, partial [Rhodospirillales bacterium]|nr:glycosyltransferase [Rhodospirillales bacterium]
MPDIAALLQRGLTAHRAGRDGDAAACYARVLARRPAQADALYLLALVRLGQLGQRAEALAEATGLLRRAVAAQPGFAL